MYDQNQMLTVCSAVQLRWLLTALLGHHLKRETLRLGYGLLVLLQDMRSAMTNQPGVAVVSVSHIHSCCVVTSVVHCHCPLAAAALHSTLTQHTIKLVSTNLCNNFNFLKLKTEATAI